MNPRITLTLALAVALIGGAGAQRYVYPAKARGACLEGRGYTVK